MIKILHMADTHVSHRKSKNVRDVWKIPNTISWIEDDYCLAFKRAIDIAIKSGCDYLVHAGDLFDVPVARNLTSPTEYSRSFVIRELNRFFKATDYKVPFIVIDGNHGTYLNRNSSTLEFLEAAFPDMVHIATNYHLKEAIMKGEPLVKSFDDVNFYLFPYLRFNITERLEKAYAEWVETYQQPDDSKTSIAVVHGMSYGIDLHQRILQLPYDYIALGHDHNQKRITKKAWQAGSTEKYTFAERNQKKGVLEVQVIHNKDPIVVPHILPSSREMVQFDIQLNFDRDLIELEKKVDDLIKKFQEPFNGDTAKRIKLNFLGNIFFSTWWRLEEKLTEMQHKILTQDYNILEFRWETTELIKTVPENKRPSALTKDYLIEDPIKDFEGYIRRMNLPDPEKAKLLIDRGAKIIQVVFGTHLLDKGEE